MDDNNLNIIDNPTIDLLCANSIELVRYARTLTLKQINSIQTMTYYCIGKWIVDEQQNGEKRAKYGKQILKNLSARLTTEFGKGFSVDTLENMRKFYLVYKNKISEDLFRKFAIEKSEKAFRILEEDNPFALSWSHYLKLMRIDSELERNFYEIECIKNNWSLPELKRQFNAALFERLALSTDKAGVMQLATKGQVIKNASDAVKDPLILEFLGLEEKSKYSENELETRILNNLQSFLLELGTGFTFVSR